MELPQTGDPQPRQTPKEMEEERVKIHRLQFVINLVMSTISQDPTIRIEEASQMVAQVKEYALAMFPDKELAYDLIYKPRLQRLLNERYRLH